jgi:hypothetical protein
VRKDHDLPRRIEQYRGSLQRILDSVPESKEIFIETPEVFGKNDMKRSLSIVGRVAMNRNTRGMTDEQVETFSLILAGF